jgi:pSer/pThr/pTyr-binding forkhead associated (FHA) protein
VPGYLLVQASNTKLPIPPGKTVVILGRTDPVSGIYPEIDLEPFNGEDLGVGRDHARLVTQGDEILLVDHHSTNGTALNKVRLKPDQKVPVNDGDEIRLGRLVLVYKVA